MPLASFTLASGQKVKLGKAPARHDSRTLQLAKYLPPTAVPPPPAKEDWEKKVKKWPVMLNDNLGDCTCACAGHMIEQWTTYTGTAVTPPDSAILAAYEAVSGYNPADPNSDKGAVILDVLNYWRNTGIAGDKIMAYTSIEPQNHNEIKDSVLLFGNCYLGVQLPLSAQNQAVWAVPPGGPTGQGAPGSWGGHAIPIVAYDVRGLTVVTWGALKRMSWGFLNAYCDEAYAVLSQDWINNVTKLAPNTFDLAALQADLNQINAVKLAAAGGAQNRRA
jgi:hypothetical protein